MATWEEMVRAHPELRTKNIEDFIQHPNGGWYEKTTKVVDSRLYNTSLVLDMAEVKLCMLFGNSKISEKAIVTQSRLTDNSLINEYAIVTQCSLYYGAVITGHTIIENHIITNAIVRADRSIQGLKLVDGTFNRIPLVISDALVGFPITIDFDDTVRIGCQKNALRDKKAWEELAKDYNIDIDIENVIKAFEILLEAARE